MGVVRKVASNTPRLKTVLFAWPVSENQIRKVISPKSAKSTYILP